MTKEQHIITYKWTRLVSTFESSKFFKNVSNTLEILSLFGFTNTLKTFFSPSADKFICEVIYELQSAFDKNPDNINNYLKESPDVPIKSMLSGQFEILLETYMGITKKNKFISKINSWLYENGKSQSSLYTLVNATLYSYQQALKAKDRKDREELTVSFQNLNFLSMCCMSYIYFGSEKFDRYTRKNNTVRVETIIKFFPQIYNFIQIKIAEASLHTFVLDYKLEQQFDKTSPNIVLSVAEKNCLPGFLSSRTILTFKMYWATEYKDKVIDIGKSWINEPINSAIESVKGTVASNLNKLTGLSYYTAYAYCYLQSFLGSTFKMDHYEKKFEDHQKCFQEIKTAYSDYQDPSYRFLDEDLLASKSSQNIQMKF